MARQDSRREVMEVVRRRPGERLWQGLIAIAVVLLLLVAAYLFGGWHYGEQFRSASSENRELRERVAALSEQNEALERTVVRLEQGAAVDRQALHEAREHILDLENQLKQERSELALFRTIVAPEESETGLQIQRMDVTETRATGRWRYNLVLTQIGENSAFLSGDASVHVLGEQNGELVRKPLAELSDEVDDEGITFRFRYFQRFSGVLTLPEGFSPKEVVVIATSGRTERERVFDWYDESETASGE